MNETKYIIEKTSVFVIDAKNEVDALAKSCMPDVQAATRVAHQVTISEAKEEESK